MKNGHGPLALPLKSHQLGRRKRLCTVENTVEELFTISDATFVIAVDFLLFVVLGRLPGTKVRRRDQQEEERGMSNEWRFWIAANINLALFLPVLSVLWPAGRPPARMTDASFPGERSSHS